jgi:hypothetical protein
MIKKFDKFVLESNFGYNPENSTTPTTEPIDAKYKSLSDVLDEVDPYAEIEEEDPYDTRTGRIVEIKNPVTWKYFTKVEYYKYREPIIGGFLPKKKKYYTVEIECKIGNDVVLKGYFGEYYEMDKYFHRYSSLDNGKLTPKKEVDFYLNNKILKAVSRGDNEILAQAYTPIWELLPTRLNRSQEFNEKFGITKDIHYLCETNKENMTYNKENWGKRNEYGSYPKHPLIGKNICDIVEVEMDWDDFYLDEETVGDVDVFGSNDKGYWGLINGDDMAFYAEKDDKVKFVTGINGDFRGVNVKFNTLFVGGHDGVEMYNIETGESLGDLF